MTVGQMGMKKAGTRVEKKAVLMAARMDGQKAE